MPRYQKKGSALSVEHELAVEYVEIDELVEHPENPRRGNVEVIAESLNHTGQYRPLIASRVTGYVLAGNHTLRAARLLRERFQSGEHEGTRLINALAVCWLDNLTPDVERRILLVDNRSADLGTYEDDMLLALLRELEEDLTGTGYDHDVLDDLSYLNDGATEVRAPDTDAHLNETPEERQERADRVGNYQTLTSQGLQEMILVLPTHKKEQSLAWIDRLRRTWGTPDLTNGEVVHAALGRLVDLSNKAEES